MTDRVDLEAVRARQAFLAEAIRGLKRGTYRRPVMVALLDDLPALIAEVERLRHHVAAAEHHIEVLEDQLAAAADVINARENPPTISEARSIVAEADRVFGASPTMGVK